MVRCPWVSVTVPIVPGARLPGRGPGLPQRRTRGRWPRRWTGRARSGPARLLMPCHVGSGPVAGASGAGDGATRTEIVVVGRWHGRAQGGAGFAAASNDRCRQLDRRHPRTAEGGPTPRPLRDDGAAGPGHRLGPRSASDPGSEPVACGRTGTSGRWACQKGLGRCPVRRKVRALARPLRRTATSRRSRGERS
jgi:hypothetical protein